MASPRTPHLTPYALALVVVTSACAEGQVRQPSTGGVVTGTSATPTATNATTGSSDTDDDGSSTADASPSSPGPDPSTSSSVTDTSSSSADSGGPVCGNGTVEGDEQCDDMGRSGTCNDDCTSALCGDGVVNATAGETCDDAGASVTCDDDCTAVECGDALVNAAAGEQCDDGDESAACDDDCTPSDCGDGVQNMAAGEACDDAGESAACDVDCTVAQCGDGVVNGSAGEACDGGGDCDPATCQPASPCDIDPVGAAVAACMNDFPNCVVQDGGVVGYADPSCTGCNCGGVGEPWRFYCTADDFAGTNYHCAACTVGEILAPHDPCNCDPGTTVVTGNFCEA